jgi:hypothetical protein
VYNPLNRTEGYFPDLNLHRLQRRECIEVRDRQFRGHVHEVVAPDIGVNPGFAEGGA